MTWHRFLITAIIQGHIGRNRKIGTPIFDFVFNAISIVIHTLLGVPSQKGTFSEEVHRFWENKSRQIRLCKLVLFILDTLKLAFFFVSQDDFVEPKFEQQHQKQSGRQFAYEFVGQTQQFPAELRTGDELEGGENQIISILSNSVYVIGSVHPFLSHPDPTVNDFGLDGPNYLHLTRRH